MKILGIKVDNVDYKQTTELIDLFIRKKEPHQIITVNPEMIMFAKKDKEFKNVLNKSDLNVTDGIGVIIAYRILGGHLKERVTGIDLVWKLAELCADKAYTIYLVGAESGVAEKVASKLQEKYPKLKIVGSESSSPHDLGLVDRICNAKPDILLVAFGHPKQEKWIFKYKMRLGVPVSIGVGGAFDFISGKVSRAPFWVQKMGFEWLYRLIKEPRRIKRQIVLPLFSGLIIRDYFKKTNKNQRTKL